MECHSFIWNAFRNKRHFSIPSSSPELYFQCLPPQPDSEFFLSRFPASYIFFQKFCFKSVRSFNSSRLWNIPSFSLDAAVSHRKKNYWLCGETWTTFFPKLTDGLKIPLIEAVLPLSSYQLVILEKELVWGNLKPTTTHNYAPNSRPEIQYAALPSPFALIQKRWRDRLTEQES